MRGASSSAYTNSASKSHSFRRKQQHDSSFSTFRTNSSLARRAQAQPVGGKSSRVYFRPTSVFPPRTTAGSRESFHHGPTREIHTKTPGKNHHCEASYGTPPSPSSRDLRSGCVTRRKKKNAWLQATRAWHTNISCYKKTHPHAKSNRQKSSLDVVEVDSKVVLRAVPFHGQVHRRLVDSRVLR